MISVVDNFGQNQKLGADGQPRPLHRIHVDGKAHSVIFNEELHAAAALRKIIALTHHKRARSIQRIKYVREVLFFFLTNENKLAGLQIGESSRSVHQNSTSIDVLPPNDFIQRAAEWVVPEYAHRKGSFFIPENIRRPFDEFRKVQKKRRLQFVLGGTA